MPRIIDGRGRFVLWKKQMSSPGWSLVMLKKVMISFILNKAYYLSLFASCRHNRKSNLTVEAEQTPCVLLGTVFWHLSREATEPTAWRSEEPALQQWDSQKEKLYQRKYCPKVPDVKRFVKERYFKKTWKEFFHDLNKSPHQQSIEGVSKTCMHTLNNC